MKKYIAVAVMLPIIAFIGAIYFYNSHISIWGFDLAKDNIKDVIVDTRDGSYMVTDPEFVLEITREVSRMEKAYKLEPGIPRKDQPDAYTRLLVQTKDNTTYGGSFWKGNGTIILDSNGYYWYTTGELFQWIDKSIKGAQKIN